MKKILYLLPLLLMSCANPSPIEIALKETVNGDGYNLLSYSVDTITYGCLKDSLQEQIQTLDKNLDKLKEMRNDQFTAPFTRIPGDEKKTEERIMNGDLSGEFAELRENILVADSLIENWDGVKDYSYEYLKTYFYLLKRTSEIVDYRRFGQSELYDNIHDAYSFIIENEKLYRKYEDAVAHDAKETFEYKVYHHYEVGIMDGKKSIEKEKFVTFDKDMNVVRIDRIDE